MKSLGKKTALNDPTMYSPPREPIVLCFLIEQNQVLLIQRALNKKVYPNLWDGVGGKIEPGETPLQACCREFLEETGLTLANPVCIAVSTVLDRQHDAERLIFVFRADAHSGDLLKQSPEGQLAWLDAAAITNLDFIPDIPIYLQIAARGEPQVVFGRVEFDRLGQLVSHTFPDKSE
jgi:8-oxo-dGTP diphosphatase